MRVRNQSKTDLQALAAAVATARDAQLVARREHKAATRALEKAESALHNANDSFTRAKAAFDAAIKDSP